MREIIKELTPLSARLGSLEAEMGNLQNTIKQNEEDIDLIESASSLAEMVSLLKMFGHPIAKGAGWTAELAKAALDIILQDKQNKLAANETKLREKKQEHADLKPKAQSLRNRLIIAEGAYNDCKRGRA